MSADNSASGLLAFEMAAAQRFVESMFRAAGWSEGDARIATDCLIGSDHAGHASHGIGLMPMYVETIKSGKLSPEWTAKVVKDEGPFVVIEGRRSLGQVGARDATLKGIETARRHGIALVNLIDSHHVGRIGHYGEMVARAGFVGLFWVNVHGRKPTVVPYGAREPRFSTNPHCVAIPRQGADPFLLDFATAEMAVNKARVAHAKGEKVRHGTLLDHQGRPTDDPGVLWETPRGSIAAFGLHKGSGLAIVCELMSAALGSGPLVADQTEAGAILNNMMAIVIDPARMATGDEPITVATDRMIAWVKSAAAAEGVAEVLTPGEPEQMNRARLGSRIEIDRTTWGEIAKAAARLGIGEASVPKPLV
jgi:uncharacterized oxidoreductase